MKNLKSALLKSGAWFYIITLSLFCSTSAIAGNNEKITPDINVSSTNSDESWWSSFKGDITDTWTSPQQQDIYLPVLTRHNRHTHSKSQIDSYNEHPWGGGYGVSRYDEKGNWHGLYAIAFKDSFNKWEPVAGYGYEKIWQPLEDKDFRLGVGYVAAVSARDNYDYVPFPMVLPLVSAGYSRLTFQATYIPGANSKGNVLFGWLRYSF